MRAAYVELNFFHGEIVPTFCRLARDAGLDLDVHVLRANAELDPLGSIPPPERPPLVPIDVPDPHDPCAGPLDHLTRLEQGRYDVLILGTADPPDRARALARLDIPQLHVVHNLDRAPAARPGVTHAVLASHARPHVTPGTVVVEPLFTGVPGASCQPAAARPVVVAVPGTVQLGRRNYGALLRALVRLRDDGVTPDDLRVALVGRAFDREPHLLGRTHYEGERLGRALDRAGVTDFVTMSPRELTYPEVHRALLESHHVLPLIDECFMPTRAYLRGKHTGSIGVGLGAGAVPILSTRHADALDLHIGPRYRLDHVEDGLRAALDTSMLDADRAALDGWREQRLAASAASFRAWLDRVT